MPTTTTLKCAGESDQGRVRTNNEDRLHFDPDRGVLIVVDGVGGQAAGEVAAETAVRVIRERLERQDGAAAERLSAGITLANNEIFRLAETTPEWAGMSCVLTAAVVEGSRLTIGHVGDTRLYKIHRGQIRKLTRDHSTVGMDEDEGRLSEVEAMHHPRRNEVLRDVGSSEHRPDDEGFIDIYETTFEPDCALLMCTDGLSDLVTSEQILSAVREHAGDPARVVRRLIEMANEAGGKDNVTVLFAEGEQFADATRRQLAEPVGADRAAHGAALTEAPATSRGAASGTRARSARWSFLTFGLLVGLAGGALLYRWYARAAAAPPTPAAGEGRAAEQQPARGPVRTMTVGPGWEFKSIGEALGEARAGDTVVVAPGDYRESLELRAGVTLVSQVPHGAAVVPPEGAAQAVLARGVEGARFVGFRVNCQPTRAPSCVRVEDSDAVLENLDVSGAAEAGVDLAGDATLLGSHVHDNAGSGVRVRAGAPRITRNLFAENGAAGDDRHFDVEIVRPARPELKWNVFVNDGLNVGPLFPNETNELLRNNLVVKPAPAATGVQGFPSQATPAAQGPP